MSKKKLSKVIILGDSAYFTSYSELERHLSSTRLQTPSSLNPTKPQWEPTSQRKRSVSTERQFIWRSGTPLARKDSEAWAEHSTEEPTAAFLFTISQVQRQPSTYAELRESGDVEGRVHQSRSSKRALEIPLRCPRKQDRPRKRATSNR